MKPLKIAVVILGFCVGYVVLAWIAGRIQYSQNEVLVENLIAQYKSIGVATTDREFFHPIPDSENAWVDIKPLLTKSEVNGNMRYPFDSQLPRYFIMAAQKNDLPTLKKYLAVSQQKREQILKLLEAKPKLQIHIDLDEGIHLHDSSYTIIRNFQNELCVAALCSTIEGDRTALFRYLKAEMRLVSSDFEGGDYTSNRAGIDGRYSLARTLYRILELRPEWAEALGKFYFAQPPIAKTNCQRIVESAFLKTLGTLRYYDVPGMDKSKPLFRIGEQRDEPDPSDGGSVKRDDHIPKSPAVRGYLVNRLQKWWPLVSHGRARKSPTSLPDIADLDAIQEPYQENYRRYVEVLKGASELNMDSDYIIQTLSRNEQLEASELLLFTVFEIRRKTGSFPQSLSQTGIKTSAYDCLGGAEFLSSNNTFSLSGRKLNGSGTPTVTISFPLQGCISKFSFENAQRNLKDFAAGKLGSDGMEINKKGSGAPSVPRGAD